MVIRGVPYESNPPLRENILTVGMCGFTSSLSQLSRYTGGDEVIVLANDHIICAHCHRKFKPQYSTMHQERNQFHLHCYKNRNDARSCWRIIREAWHTLWTNNVAEDEVEHSEEQDNIVTLCEYDESLEEQQVSQQLCEQPKHECYPPVLYRATCDIAPRLLHNIFPSPEVHEIVHSVKCCQCCQGTLKSHAPIVEQDRNRGRVLLCNGSEHRPRPLYCEDEEDESSLSCCCCCCCCCSYNNSNSQVNNPCCWTCNPVHWLFMFKEWLCGYLFHVKPIRCCYSELGRTNLGGNRDQAYFIRQIYRAVEVLKKEEEEQEQERENERAIDENNNILVTKMTLKNVSINNNEDYNIVRDQENNEEEEQQLQECDELNSDHNINIQENINDNSNYNNVVMSDDEENVTDSINTINVVNETYSVERITREEEEQLQQQELLQQATHEPFTQELCTNEVKAENTETDNVNRNNHTNSNNNDVNNSNSSSNSINLRLEPQILHGNDNNNNLIIVSCNDINNSNNNNITINTLANQDINTMINNNVIDECNNYNVNNNEEGVINAPRCRKRHLVLFGVSRGATTCFYSALKLPAQLASYVSLVIVEAPFDTLQHVIASSTEFPSLTTWLFKSFCDYRGKDDEQSAYSYDASHVHLRCPVAFVISEIDRRVPNTCTLHLINTLKEQLVPHIIPAVEVLVLKHSRHPCMPLAHKEDQDAYVAFVERLYTTYCS